MRGRGLAPDPGLARVLLSSCLDAVRPAEMLPEAAEDWLCEAARLVAHLPASVLDHACLAAKRGCSHPGQVVRAILEEAVDYAERRGITLPAPKRMTQVDVDRMPPELVSLGIAGGWLIRGGDDGRPRLAE